MTGDAAKALTKMAKREPRSRIEDVDGDFAVPDPKSEIARRLRLAVEEGGGNQAVAAKSGVALGTLNNYLRGVNEPRATALAKIATATGRSMDWFVAVDPPPSEAGLLQAGDELASRAGGELALLAARVVNVERLSFAASTGSGSLVFEDVQAQIPIPIEFLDRINLRPEDARVLENVGNSMVPTIRDGSFLIINVSTRARERISDDAIYAFTVGDEAFIKRLRREPGRLMMVSDNAEHFPPRAIPHGEPFHIFGRVDMVVMEL